MNSNIKSFEIREHYLLIVAQGGVRKSLLEAAQGAQNLETVIRESKKNKVLMDYREVFFDVQVADAFNITRYYEKLPHYAIAKVASLINEKTVPLATVWEDFARKRGFDYKFFTAYQAAEDWLLSDDKNS